MVARTVLKLKTSRSGKPGLSRKKTRILGPTQAAKAAARIFRPAQETTTGNGTEKSEKPEKPEKTKKNPAVLLWTVA